MLNEYRYSLGEGKTCANRSGRATLISPGLTLGHQTFGGKHAADRKESWDTGRSQGMPPSVLRKVTKRKLQMANAARQLKDLSVPPGNYLEKLEGDRGGRHSICRSAQY